MAIEGDFIEGISFTQLNCWLFWLIDCGPLTALQLARVHTRYQPLAAIHVAPGARTGSIVHFTAQAAMMNADCPSAPALVISATIE